jgi:hypothetical protein
MKELYADNNKIIKIVKFNKKLEKICLSYNNLF